MCKKIAHAHLTRLSMHLPSLLCTSILSSALVKLLVLYGLLPPATEQLTAATA